MVDCDDFTGRNNVVMCAVLVDARLNVNVALNRPSYQVSNYKDIYLASNANDGSHHTDMKTSVRIPAWERRIRGGRSTWEWHCISAASNSQTEAASMVCVA